MFAQIIRGSVSDPRAIDETFNRWSAELAPCAKGWLGTTGGVTDNGELFVMVRFESEESARANSNRPEQDRFWTESSKSLDGEATFQDSSDVMTDLRGDLDSAGFVQVMIGQTRNEERSKQLMADTQAARIALRPDILGQVAVGHGDGRFTMVNYFTSEEAARQGERKEIPPEFQPVMQEMMSLSVGQPEFLDLKKPWLHSAPSSDL
jgi:hypothetical protein